ncbi:MAG: thioredoxin family protein [Pseudomonadales bacterium]|jgi:thiol:disulfide interchange protein DsbD|nr:thioredoxin family protein [Pseudomonadales bacterium]
MPIHSKHARRWFALIHVVLLMVLLSPLLAQAQAQEQVQRYPLVQGQHVAAQLVPERLAAVPGETLWVALRLVHMESWHTYWINPGDAGKATTVTWNLPQGVSAGAIIWPTPQRFDLPADLTDFGYTGEVFLLAPLSIESDFVGDSVALGAQADWLECDDICIPGGAQVELELSVQRQGLAPGNDAFAYGFAATRAALPRADINLTSSFGIRGGKLELLVQATENIFEGATAIRFIPDTHRIVDYLAPQRITTQFSSLQLSQALHPRPVQALPERLGGLLLVTTAPGQQVAYQIQAQPDPLAMSAAAEFSTHAAPALPLYLVFGFALLGGLILNLMPCVFPVLSLKVLSLAHSAHGPQHEQRWHGIAYTGGVLVSFLVLALALLLLQAGGAAIGWGFQLQHPWFVGALVFLFFVMGLSMSGVVEFGASLMGVGADLQEREGYSGSFFTGVLASVVASPCTAPFMGAALGFAFTQNMPVALTVFLALGLGMALPFLVLSFVPALARLLPKPGAWMLGFRQFLAFPLYATAVWLLWVLGHQGGVDAMALVAGGCVLLALAAWSWQRRHRRGGIWHQVWLVVSLASVTLAGATLFSPFLRTNDAVATTAETHDTTVEPYSAARFAALRAAGKPVFVNMTAAWCITCLVNEKVALSSAAVASAMTEKGVTYLKGDWTNNDPAITEVLRHYDTSGVPLYLLFPADPNASADVLPQILTEGVVLEALGRI